MTKVKLVRPYREARNVRILYRNPALRTRSGQLANGTVIFEVEGGLRFEVHTVYAVANILGRSAARVHQLLETEKLLGYRVGRDWIVLDIDLRQFIKQERAKLTKRFSSFLKE